MSFTSKNLYCAVVCPLKQEENKTGEKCIVLNLVFELLSTVYLNVKIALIFRENINMFV